MAAAAAVFCKDCKHFLPPTNAKVGGKDYYAYAKCSAVVREAGRLDLISGITSTTYQYCDMVRMRDGQCGPAGKRFELKAAPTLDMRDPDKLAPSSEGSHNV